MKRAGVLLLLALLKISTVFSSEVIPYEGGSPSLMPRWNWALQQAHGHVSQNGFWIAYSIERMMPENTYVGSFYMNDQQRGSLLEILTGHKVVKPLGNSPRPVLKEIAILFEFDALAHLREVHVCHLDLWFPLKGYPVFWLGAVTQEQSIVLLGTLYDSATDLQKEGLVMAIGAHGNSGLTVPLLKKGLGERSAEVRGQAASGLARQDDPRVLEILKPFVEQEQSEDVIELAMCGIAEMSSREATQLLMDWTGTKYNRKIRSHALLNLAHIAAEDTIRTLRNVAYNDSDTEVQKQALYALSDMEDGKGLAEVIHIATNHPNREVRKAAIYMLGDSEDPRARAALLEIVASINRK